MFEHLTLRKILQLKNKVLLRLANIVNRTLFTFKISALESVFVFLE